MATDLSTTFTGVRFRNPFLLSSAPPTESESNILRASRPGWGGGRDKTIGPPIVNVLGPARSPCARTPIRRACR
jgi:dihydroorotate dehydrogenase